MTNICYQMSMSSNLEKDVQVFSVGTNELYEYGSFEIDEVQGELEHGLSPLARRDRLHPGTQPRIVPWRDKVYGLVVHTTGGSLPGQARKAGISPDLSAVRHYLRSGGTHYVNGWAGAEGQQLHQVMNERNVALGVGRPPRRSETISKTITRSVDLY